ncbi:MAG: hypothetical protein PWP60_288 [Candidatus Atribacteria bacterium]|uniref:cytoplasmic protein n=1 Tax=Atrimonas thermophila TaxID=3064161 RepID=UPI0024AC20DC|nr:hypothetical protein [Candidatus Atribacteria bacterium]MDI3530439.1 hypothetical protein [Candidatus Atribacteria bacterium]
MQKVAFFVFRDQEMCFIHVLLNALDMYEKGNVARIVFEGSATRLVPLLAEASHSLHGLYRETKDKGLIAGACRACSAKMKVLDAVEKEGLPLLEDMKGHPGMHRFLAEGFVIITM